jgi:UDP-N-acetylmuramoylalanine--D-glutamate ligase
MSVVGAARSGLAVANLLKERGAEVFVSEKAPAETMGDARRELERIGVAFEFGGNSPRVLECERVVVSPGVPSDAPVIRQALERGLIVVSELEVASWFCTGPMVAITGTNGKTTTTTLAGRIFSDARLPSVVAGNIGTAFSQVVDQMTPGMAAILEVSSFQLDYVHTFRPTVAAILNITPDHLDRYDHSFEQYIAAKQRVFARQGEGDALIYNYDDEVTREVVRTAPKGVRLLPFSVREQPAEGAFLDDGNLVTVIGGKRAAIIAPEAISIRGVHNLYNAMAATLAARSMEIPAASIRSTLKNFKGVEHRLEFVEEIDGVSFVNDSKATNVDSVWYALQSFTSPLIVILGGRDKGNDYTRLRPLVAKYVKGIVAIGESAEKVVQAFADQVQVKRGGSMEEAVHVAAAMATAGDIVLLSPACASFDWFRNYEHRGEVFKTIVRMRAAGHGQA